MRTMSNSGSGRVNYGSDTDKPKEGENQAAGDGCGTETLQWGFVNPIALLGSRERYEAPVDK